MGYIPINVVKPSGPNPGSGAPKSRLVLILADDTLSYPSRDDKGVATVGNLVPRVGGKMITVYITKSKTNTPIETDGDEDAQSFKQKVEVQVPGNSLELKEFVQNWLGKDCYAILDNCQDDYKELFGTPCAPLQLKATRKDDNDGRNYTLMFEQFAKSAYLPGHYTGDLAFADPTAVSDNTAAALTKANGTQFKLASTSSATAVGVANINHDHGTILTLIGSGGTTATTLSNGTVGTNIEVLLKDGTQWSALNNAVINLRVFKAGTKTYLMELSRG